MKVSDKLSGISRRDLFKLAGQYGMSSTLLAAGAFTGAVTLPSLAKAVESTYDKRYAKEAKVTLKFGAAGFNQRNLLNQHPPQCNRLASDSCAPPSGIKPSECFSCNRFINQ